MSQVEIKPSLLSYKLAETIADEELHEENSVTLKENYIHLIDQLEIDGIPKEKISTIGKQIIIERKKQKLELKGIQNGQVTVGSWWNEVAREKGCTDTKYSPTKDEEVTVAEHENTSINTPKKPNIRYIDYLKRTKEICDIAIKKFQTSESIEDTLNKKQFQILNHEWNAVLDTAEDCFNEKTKVPLNTQQIMVVEAATASSITDAAKTFQVLKFQEYKKLGKFITSKQIGKFMDGTIPESLSIFKPDSRDTAIFQRFYGLSCPKCDSFRVTERTGIKKDGSNLDCIDCDTSFKGRNVNKCRYCQIPLYKEDLLDMVTAQRQRVKNMEYTNDESQEIPEYPCTSCGTDNHLPLELVEYAQS